MPVNVRSFIQRIYALNQPDDAWLAGLAAAGEESFGQGLGSYALMLDARAPSASRVRSVACVGAIAGSEKVVEEVVSALPLADLQQLATLAPKAAVGGAARSGQPGLASWLARSKARDMLTLLCTDPGNVSVVIGTNLPRKHSLAPKLQGTLAQLAAHVATARHLLNKEQDDVDAVFDFHGAPLSAHGEAADDEALARQLHRTARALVAVSAEREGRALPRFKSRVDARWSLLFQMQRGGHEYIVARRSLPPVFRLEVLSAREREVASYLAVGHSLKEIAYELGLSASTVRVLAARAAQKLGATSSKQLGELVRARVKPKP